MKVIVSDGRGRQVRHLVVQAPSTARLADLMVRLGPGGPMPAVDVALRHGQELWPAPGVGPGPVGWTATRTSGPVVVIASGPDAGGSLELPPGRWMVVGRDPSCDLTVKDPSLSRQHVRIRLDRDCVQVEDLSSTNGVAWERGGDSRVWGAPEDRLLLGHSSLVLVPRPPAPASVVELDGRLGVVPWRRVQPNPRPVELTSPAAPELRTVRRPSVWAWALPLAVAAVVALVLRMPWLLVFGLLGPAMVFGHHLGDRRAAREEHREALVARRQQLDDLDVAARGALADELTLRRAADPGLVGVAAALAAGPTTRLWECAGESLTAVLGESPQDAVVTVDGTLLRHDRAPVLVDVGSPLVVVGPAGLRDALVRSLMLQLAARHPPDTFALAVDPSHPPDEAWDLLAWLPHTRVGGGGQADVVWGAHVRLVDDPREAPPDLPRVLLLGPDRAVLQRPGLTSRPFQPTLLGLSRARALARTLAPLCAGGPGPGRDRGTPSSLGQLLPWPCRVEDAARGWRRPGLVVPLGLDPDGSPVMVDLSVDGPHALVAGTTGSGKSELLRALVVGLALRNSPAELSLLLVDYKGGSSLGSCAGLPQVTGLVTDLDAHLAERVLLSLQAELTRREQVLQAAGARDIRAHVPGLPRLVVVIDEFRVLAEEVPEVMDGLVRVAAVGRSLGVHLVLATQRPAGVVGADLRANVNLRIALRVRDTADSYDVLECADAAHLPEGRPGLALLRTGASPARTVQVAIPGPPPEDHAPTDGWHISEHPDVWTARAALEIGGAHVGPSEADPVGHLATTLSMAADDLGLSAQPVWLPPLAEDLCSDPGTEGAWAVADLPGQQRQPPLTWSGDHHIGVVGAARSGRTTALSSLLSRNDAWFVVLDLGRALDGGPIGAEDPRCCAWVAPDDHAYALRVLDVLLDLVRRRQAEPSLLRDAVVLAVDGWDRLVDQLGQVESGRAIEVVQRILREGPGVGVSAIVTGDRSLLLGAMAALLPETWMLHLNDPADLLLTGLRASQVPGRMPPGRMVRARDGVVAQVVRADPSGSRTGRPPTGSAPPLRCIPLPHRACAPDRTVWAVGGDEARPVPFPAGAVLVLGPPGSGRTRTLVALAAAAGGSVLSVHGADPPTEAQLEARLSCLGVDDLISVDDAHLLAGTRVEDLLVGHAARHGPRAALHVAAELEGAGTAFRGLLPQLARSRTAVVLHPGMPGDGALVGARLPVGDLSVPGRGVLVHRGRATRIQVVAPGPSDDPGATAGGPACP